MTERPGRDFLIRTGQPADGSQADRSHSTQHLVNPREQNPESHAAVRAWVSRRAHDDQQMQTAGAGGA
jgi:hypothetical protein